MNYLYHRVPQNIKGRFLMPLNELKQKYPKIYNEHIKKYAGRMETLEDKIPPLNCLWNDVLHMTAVHPKKVYNALKSSGFKRGLNGEKWFEIDPELIDRDKTVVSVGEDSYVRFNLGDLEKYSEIRKWTLDYYKKQIRDGKIPLMFYKVPHVLFKGHLDTSKLNIITI